MDGSKEGHEVNHVVDGGRVETVVLNYQNIEIKSRNYRSLLEAMGGSKYGAYKWGEGLSKAPTEIQNAIRDISPSGARYSVSEYVENGKIRNHMFIEQELPDGSICIFTVDLDRSKPYLYRLENTYVLGSGGITSDIMEELDTDTKVYFTPTPFNCFNPIKNVIYFGDLEQLSTQLGINAGVPVYLHEIGHWYDSNKNNHLYSGWHADQIWAKSLGSFQGIFGNKRESSIPLVQQLLKIAENGGQDLLSMERNASNYAAYYIVNKRNEKFDITPNKPGGSFFEQLQLAYGTYEILLLGRMSESIEKSNDRREFVFPVSKNVNGLRRAMNAFSNSFFGVRD